MESVFSKLKSVEAKGLCIIIMMIHHLFAFPERLDYAYVSSFFVKLGQECGIIVGLYVFITGYGSALKPLTLEKCLKKNVDLWKNFSFVFFIFVPMGLILGVYRFEIFEFLKNLFFIQSSYNHEWWFFGLYVKLIVLSFLLSYVKNDIAFCGISIVLVALAIVSYKYEFLDLKYYLPVFMLSYCVSKFSLFEKTENISRKYIGKDWIRSLIYMVIAFVVGHYFRELKFIQFFFWFLAFSLIEFSDRISSVWYFLAKHSVNMWLVHTFYCYYYFKSFFIALSNPVVALVFLVVASLLTSILIEYIKNRLRCLKTYFL